MLSVSTDRIYWAGLAKDVDSRAPGQLTRTTCFGLVVGSQVCVFGRAGVRLSAPSLRPLFIAYPDEHCFCSFRLC
jgi:hypothetical protein